MFKDPFFFFFVFLFLPLIYSVLTWTDVPTLFSWTRVQMYFYAIISFSKAFRTLFILIYIYTQQFDSTNLLESSWVLLLHLRLNSNSWTRNGEVVFLAAFWKYMCVCVNLIFFTKCWLAFNVHSLHGLLCSILYQEVYGEYILLI